MNDIDNISKIASLESKAAQAKSNLTISNLRRNQLFYLLLLALQQGWEGSVVFPVNNVGVLVLAAFFGIVLFSEKLNRIKLAGFVLSLLAIFFITYSS